MRFSFALLSVLLAGFWVMPLSANPVYVHARTHKVKKHKAIKHRSMQG